MDYDYDAFELDFLVDSQGRIFTVLFIQGGKNEKKMPTVLKKFRKP